MKVYFQSLRTEIFLKSIAAFLLIQYCLQRFKLLKSSIIQMKRSQKGNSDETVAAASFIVGFSLPATSATASSTLLL